MNASFQEFYFLKRCVFTWTDRLAVASSQPRRLGLRRDSTATDGGPAAGRRPFFMEAVWAPALFVVKLLLVLLLLLFLLLLLVVVVDSLLLLP